MVSHGLEEMMRQEGRGIGIIAIALFAISLAIVGMTKGSIPGFSYGDVANLVVAIVAVSSLYIAWRELIRKTQPNVIIDFGTEYSEEDGERMVLKLTNSGANIINPLNTWYAVARLDGDGYFFSNNEMGVFEDDVLMPGETSEVVIGDEVVVMLPKSINIKDWTGSGVTLEDFDHDMKQIRLGPVDAEGDVQVKIQKIFNIVMDLPYRCGITIPSDEILSSSVNEIEARRFPDHQYQTERSP